MTQVFEQFISRSSWALLAVILASLVTADCVAQAIAVSTPFTTANDSFYERSGINFGFRLPAGRGNGSRVVGLGPGGQMIPNVTFGQGSFGSAIPPFGGYDPNSSLQTGFGLRFGNGGGIDFGLELGKGSNRTVTNQTPTVVMQNGGFGSIFDGNVRPFVTGVTPIIGGQQNPLYQAVENGQLDLSRLGQGETHRQTSEIVATSSGSTAMNGDLSVASIKAQRSAAKSAEEQKFRSLLAAAIKFEESEDYRQARITFRKAMIKCQDSEMKKRIKAKLKELKGL